MEPEDQEIEAGIDAAADQDAVEDAWLEANLGDEDDPEEPEDEPEGEDGAEAAEAADGDEEPDEEPQEAAEAGGETEQPDVDEEAYRLAAARLRRDGFTTEDIALLPAERVLSLGSHRAKVQADVDDAFDRLTKLERTPPGERTGSKNDAEAAREKDSVLTRAQALADDLGLDDEGVERLAGLVEDAHGPLLERLEAQGAALKAITERTLRAEAEAARQDLKERFPQVRDASSPEFKRVLQRMNRLQTSGGYQSARELMEDAVLMEFREEIRGQASEAKKASRKARANGQVVNPRTQPRAKQSSKPKTESEIEDAVLKELLSADDDNYAEALKRAAATARRTR